MHLLLSTLLDCTYHYYLNGDSIVEVRNGSNLTLKQQVWGLQYVDELLQTSVNADLSADSSCENLYWVCQDANYNVLGLVDGSGVLSERYEYKPYGERMVVAVWAIGCSLAWLTYLYFVTPHFS